VVVVVGTSIVGLHRGLGSSATPTSMNPAFCCGAGAGAGGGGCCDGSCCCCAAAADGGSAEAEAEAVGGRLSVPFISPIPPEPEEAEEEVDGRVLFALFGLI
jgi:hypothetical protein